MEFKRVVVTGMGIVTSLGSDLDTYWNNLKNGKSGISRVEQFDTTDYTTKIAGEVKDFEPTDYLDAKEARQMDRVSQFGVVAADKAIADSGIDWDQTDRDEVGVIVASGIGGMITYENECEKMLERGPRRVSPFFIPKIIPDITSGHVSIRHGLKGINYCTVSACASASHAIGDAFFHIQAGRAIAIVTGGCEAPINRMSVAGFNSLKATSTRNDDPEHASRPFDKERDGFVMGEGGAGLLLEELEHAKARGAKIYGEVIGAGFTGDAYHITAPIPDGNGAFRAMKSVMKQAGITPADVDYINAHGTSTEYNDKIETGAIKQAFGDLAYKIPISSTKSMVGHLLGASGAAEAIACMKTLMTGEIHPTANYEIPDPNCDLDYVTNGPIKKDVKIILSNSFGFGGHNVCLAFKKYND